MTNSYITMVDKQYVVGIDVGGQTSKIGVVDTRGDVLYQTVIRSDIYGDDAEAFLAALAKAVKDCIAASGKEGEIRGVGVGAPNGNYYTGEVAYAPNLAWASKKSVKFAKILSKNLDGIPVTLTNDANAAAMGEMTYGAARGMKNFIMITLGTGVGSGIVIDGNVVYGHDGFAGELGHTTVVRHNGRTCGCGRQGCLEAYCSARRCSADMGISLHEFFRRLERGDVACSALWDDMLHHLSVAVNNINLALDCDVVLGGALSYYLPAWLPKLRSYVGERNPFDAEGSFVRLSVLKSHSVPLGAALYFLRQFVDSI